MFPLRLNGNTKMATENTFSKMRVFLIVWLGQLVSLTGSSITSFALGIWVYQTTGSVTQFGLILFFAALPGVLLSPLAGAVVDRLNYRLTMALSDTGAVLTTVVIGLLLWSGELEIWHIYIATAINSSLSAFQWPAYVSATTLLVPRQQLGRASGMTQMGRATAQLIAPLLGAILLGTIELKGIILLDIGSFVFAIITLMSVRFPRIKRADSKNQHRSSLFEEIKFGWRYVTTRPGILGLLLFFGASNFLGGTLEVLVTPLVLSFSSTVTLGVILSTGGIGMLAGSLVMSLWGGPKHLMRAVFGFMILCGVSTVIAGLQASVVLIASAAFVFFFSIPIINGCSQVILQRKVDPKVQGRVFALEGAIGSASLSLAYVVAGLLADQVFEPLMAVGSPLAGSIGQIIGSGAGRGIGLLFVLIGILTVTLTLIAQRYPRLRRIEDELPDSIPDEYVCGEKSDARDATAACHFYSEESETPQESITRGD